MQPFVDAIDSLVSSARGPVIVGLDGRSGAGKSTLAIATARRLAHSGISASVIEGDDFYAGGTGGTWDARNTAQKIEGVIDWRRQLAVLNDFLLNGCAEWAPFDWESDDWDSPTAPLSTKLQSVSASSVLILEGAYSCRPELHEHLDLRVLLDVSRVVRRRQLLEREGEDYRADWEARWSDAEDHYFSVIMPESAFDLVVRLPLSPSNT